MISIRGEKVSGGLQVRVDSEKDARLVQEEMPNCRFVASCGCGFKEVGGDGVALFKLAQKHAKETGHGAMGHFLFEAGRP